MYICVCISICIYVYICIYLYIYICLNTKEIRKPLYACVVCGVLWMTDVASQKHAMFVLLGL